MDRTVVVGVEGTESSFDALDWAAGEADARRDVLEIVHAVGVPYAALDMMYDDARTDRVEALLQSATSRAQQSAPGLDVRTVLSPTTPAMALTAASQHAALVVVGSRPLGVLERAFAGSLSYQVVAGAHCPVLLVPQGTGERGLGVFVGVDGSDDSTAAVEIAAREADRLGQELTVVHSWQSPVSFVSVDVVSGSYDPILEEKEDLLLAESLAGLGEQYPDLTVRRLLIHRQPAQALLDAARGARLLVVGSRGRGGVARMLLGSVSHTVVVHAHCPVLVVRQ